MGLAQDSVLGEQDGALLGPKEGMRLGELDRSGMCTALFGLALGAVLGKRIHSRA